MQLYRAYDGKNSFTDFLFFISVVLKWYFSARNLNMEYTVAT